MRVLRYLSRTPRVGLLYKRGASKELWGYVDASHTSCPDKGKGRAAYVFMSGGAPVSWANKRVGGNLLSSCVTEFMGADMMTKSVGPAVPKVNMKLIGMFRG